MLKTRYALGYGSMYAPGAAKPVLLAADTLFVGYLGALVSGTCWSISEHARTRVVRGA